MKRSLRWRFTIPYIVFVVLAAAGLSVFFSITFRQTYEGFAKENLVSEANLLLDEISRIDTGELSIEEMQSLVNRFASNLDVRVTIIQPDGNVIIDSESDVTKMDNHLTRPEVQQALKGEIGFQKRYSKTLRTDFFYIAIAQMDIGEVFRVVRVSEPLSAITETVKKINQVILLGAVLAILLFSILSYLISKRTIKPIVQLTEAAKRLSVGNFEHLPITDSRNEIGILTKAFSSDGAPDPGSMEDDRHRKTAKSTVSSKE